ncbi:hypothetical protein HDU76_011309, partial [Blyttiomyces sp. JEL0837]
VDTLIENLAIKSSFNEDVLRWEITSQMKYPGLRPTATAENELDWSLPTYREASVSHRSNQRTLREIMNNDFIRAFAPYLKKAENGPVDIVHKVNLSEASLESITDNTKPETRFKRILRKIGWLNERFEQKKEFNEWRWNSFITSTIYQMLGLSLDAIVGVFLDDLSYCHGQLRTNAPYAICHPSVYTTAIFYIRLYALGEIPAITAVLLKVSFRCNLLSSAMMRRIAHVSFFIQFATFRLSVITYFRDTTH